MPIKLTKRKGFNFFRSYYDVYNELETDADKVAFIDALLDRQFLGIKPTNLKGMAKFAYISQTNSIDSQVKGYEDKTKTILTPTVGGCVGGSATPCQQVEEKEEVKDIIQPKVVINWDSLLTQFNNLTKREFKLINDATKKQILTRLKEGYTKEDLWNAIQNCYNDDFHKENNHKYLTLEFISRAKMMEKYSVDVVKSKKIDKSEIGKL
jgi:uncharacterized phage protein (TIGR02220 family)